MKQKICRLTYPFWLFGVPWLTSSCIIYFQHKFFYSRSKRIDWYYLLFYTICHRYVVCINQNQYL